MHPLPTAGVRILQTTPQPLRLPGYAPAVAETSVLFSRFAVSERVAGSTQGQTYVALHCVASTISDPSQIAGCASVVHRQTSVNSGVLQ
jgi:hypothetical protein